ncbi:MAG: hypothetical protein QOI04_2236 [Verrucomicrobiota bacterium]|jgi:hypothetical protein
MRIPNFGYHLARSEGAAIRRLYHNALPMIVRRKIQPPAEIPVDLVTYSGEAALAEQVASIRSFLRHAGRPKQCTIFSDGTYTSRSIDLLERIDPVVHVSTALPAVSPQFPEKFRAYLANHPTGKQLAVIMSIFAKNQPAIYADSDVLFFAGAQHLSSLIGQRDAPAMFLADCIVAADERLFRDPSEREQPVNTGFLLLFQPLDWSLALRRFGELDGAPNFFTNQTITHLTMHANGALPFDPRKYVLQLDDQFMHRVRYAGGDLALRHYVNPVRHKFWTSLFR